MDQQSSLSSACRDLGLDLVEREHAMRDISTDRHLQDEERRRQPARDHDLRRTQLVEREQFARDDDRSIAGAEARAMRKQEIAVLYERIRRRRHGRHLQAPLERELVQRLNVVDHRLELVAASIDGSGGEPPEHERVVGIRTEAHPDQHAAGG